MTNLLHDPRAEWTKSMHIASQVNNRKHTSEQKEDVPGHFKLVLTCQEGYCSIVTGITSPLKCRWYKTTLLCVSQFRTRSFTGMLCQNGETFNVHGETNSFCLQLCHAHSMSLILIMILPDSLARFCLKKSPNK